MPNIDSLQKLLMKIALKFDLAVCRYSKCRNGIKIILFREYNKNSLSSPGASQKLASGKAPNKSKMETTAPNMQCKANEAVTTDFLSLSSAVTRWATNGFRIKPLRTISRMAVTLVNSTQMPISDFGIIRTMKKMFRKPKKTTAIRFNNENAPLDSQREYA